MNRALLTVIVVVVLVLGSAVACSGTRVRSGEVGVRVVDLGPHAGVQEHELGVGWYFPQLGSYVLKFPTTTRTEVWADTNSDAIGPALSFNNGDGVPTRMAVSVQVRIDPERASNAVQRYRLGFDDMVRGPVQRDLQDAFVRLGPHYTSQQLVSGEGSQLLTDVTALLNQRLGREGVIIDNINLVGSPILPDEIRARINQRIEAEQNVATQEAQVRVVQAQAQQRVAEAEGRARATQIEGAALAANPQVLRMREIERWNGQCPLDTKTCVIGSGALVSTPGEN
ncbi:MAG TPA: SPFH domain-containing protein [Caulobacterales bacterium]|nr:SPFH domain-containing protein [Caulobacterales bacterium]